MEKTLILLKPDTVKRGLIGQIITRIENKNLKIIDLKMMKLYENIINEHYAHLTDKPFFPRIRDYMMSGEVVAIWIEWTEAVKTMRNLTWATNPLEANPGTIRWDFALIVDENIIHASDSVENALIEYKRFFNK